MSDERGIPWADETDMLKPKQIDIEVTAACNLKCKFCPRPLDVNTHMDPDLYKSIIDRAAVELPKATIVPWLNGEPLMHPDYAELIEYTTAAKLRAYITTNGMFWNERLFQHITERNSLYQIIFSLDGLPCSYSRSIEIARPGTDREKVLDTIQQFGALKTAKGHNIDMAVKIVRRGQDWGEIEQFIDYWLASDYVDYVCVGDALVERNDESMRIFPCQYSDNNFMVIKYDGRLTTCAYNPEMTNDPAYALGRMDKTTPLLELYNSPAYQEFRYNQRRGVFPEPCKHCGFSYTGYGFTGMVRLRDHHLTQEPLYFHRDYYNSFFSKVHKEKPDSYYLQQGKGDDTESV